MVSKAMARSNLANKTPNQIQQVSPRNNKIRHRLAVIRRLLKAAVIPRISVFSKHSAA
jgi:hypothetical protein